MYKVSVGRYIILPPIVMEKSRFFFDGYSFGQGKITIFFGGGSGYFQDFE
jgi:hypothetical protein